MVRSRRQRSGKQPDVPLSRLTQAFRAGAEPSGGPSHRTHPAPGSEFSLFTGEPQMSAWNSAAGVCVCLRLFFVCLAVVLVFFSLSLAALVLFSLSWRNNWLLRPFLLKCLIVADFKLAAAQVWKVHDRWG